MERYYTVEQISQMLNIHPKTIQRYIREGKLAGKKVGKGWRITGHDLSVFVEQAAGESKQAAANRADGQNGMDRARVSAVIDIDVDDHEEAIRIANSLTALLNTKPPEYGRSSMGTQYIEPERRLRIMLWGSVKLTEHILGSLSMLMEQKPWR